MSSRPATSAYFDQSTSYPASTSDQRPRTSRPRTARPRTGLSTVTGQDPHHVVCAISESRGISPTVGLALVNLDTAEAILCQIADTQTYVRTLHKLNLREPTEVLVVQTALQPAKSKLVSILEEELDQQYCQIVAVERRYFSESDGLDMVHDLAFAEDMEAIKSAIIGNFYAICSFSAVSTFARYA